MQGFAHPAQPAGAPREMSRQSFSCCRERWSAAKWSRFCGHLILLREGVVHRREIEPAVPAPDRKQMVELTRSAWTPAELTRSPVFPLLSFLREGRLPVPSDRHCRRRLMMSGTRAD